MNIIDQYITDHYHEPLLDIAIKLGLTTGYVGKRKFNLKPPIELITKQQPVSSDWIDNEPLALIQFIIERKEGWAVDVAKSRLKKLQEMK